MVYLCIITMRGGYFNCFIQKNKKLPLKGSLKREWGVFIRGAARGGMFHVKHLDSLPE
jgi:hypothetical protein